MKNCRKQTAPLSSYPWKNMKAANKNNKKRNTINIPQNQRLYADVRDG